MNNELKSILSRVDHTLLAQSATWNEIKAICDDGIRYGCASVCIPASYVKQAAEYVAGQIAVCTVIGFPNGYDTTAAKCFEATDAVNNGASEIDMVINIGWVKDGLYDKVLSEIRARGDTPVIMLTALDQDLDKLMGLRMGADDYVVKPFNPAEVVARVQAVLRRSQAAKQTTARVLRVGPFQIDLESHEASLCRDDGQLVLDLTLTEFKLLASLMRAPKRVFSRAELLTHCLPEGDTQERTVDSHISKLRKKLEAHGIQGVPASVWGVGYRFGGDA